MAERTAELEDLAARLIGAHEAERSRIGRELHDRISQMLGILMLQLDQLRADPSITAPTAQALSQIRESASGLASDVHRLSHRLHSSTLDYLGLVPALQKLAGEFSAQHGIPVGFVHAATPARLPPEVALSLFRTVEESLTNVARHARARRADVELRGASDGLHLTIHDDGIGFDAAGRTGREGLGLVSMQERLRVHQGTVRIESAPGAGTTIVVCVPAERLAVATPG